MIEKSALRAVLTGKSISSAAEAHGLSDRAVKSAFERLQSAVMAVMRDSGKRFVRNSLAASSPQDVFDITMMELGWQSDEDFDDTAPDYSQKQEEKREKEKQDSKKLVVWESLIEEMAKQVMAELGWKTDDGFGDTSADFLKNQKRKRMSSNQPVLPEISKALAVSRAITAQAVREAKAKIPAIIANDDLRIDLENFAWDLSDIIEGMPAEQRRPFVDAAIADWLENNAEAIRKTSKTNG